MSVVSASTCAPTDPALDREPLQPGVLRKSTPSKQSLRSKFVQVYEALFAGTDPSDGSATFWDDLLMLKVNTVFLQAALDAMSQEEVVRRKDVINALFWRCGLALKDDNRVRVGHALQTLECLFRALFRKKLTGYTLIDTMVGFDVAEHRSKALLEGVYACLLRDAALSTAAVRVLRAILTTCDNVSQNTFVEYMVATSGFDALLQIFGSKMHTDAHGYDALLLLVLLTNYRKHEILNPYLRQLATFSDEVLLTAVAAVIADVIQANSQQWLARIDAPSPGFLQHLGSLVGGLFVGGEDVQLTSVRGEQTAAVLLALYEIVHLNPNLVTMLAYTKRLKQQSAAEGAASADIDVPTNLFSHFLTFASFLLHDTKTADSRALAKLSFLVLMCVCEDTHANAFLHDPNIAVPVLLYKMAMRHRPSSVAQLQSGHMAGPVIDLCIEFLQSHLKKNLDVELYGLCLAIVHRLLCYQKRHRVRLAYSWKPLWAALMGLAAFLLVHAKDLPVAPGTITLAAQIAAVFNLFITYGDTFLPDPVSYDDLYYELIRVGATFDSLYELAKRHMRADPPAAPAAARLAADLANIRAITSHFGPKIEAWLTANGVASPSADQVLALVRDHYDTLTLKLQDNLDHFEKFAENPGELSFLAHITQRIVRDSRGPCSAPRTGHIVDDVDL